MTGPQQMTYTYEISPCSYIKNVNISPREY